MTSPSIAVLLRGLLEDAKRTGTPISKTQLAEQTGVVPSAVTGWFNGQSPRDAQLDKISSIFSFGDLRRELEIRTLLYGAVGRSIHNGSSAIDRARERSALINIGVVKYSRPVSDFFGHLAKAFGDFCGFLANVQSVSFAELEDRIKEGEIDIGFGLWETPSRLRNLHFLGTPLAVGMAVLAADDRILREHDGKFVIESDRLAPIMHQDQEVFHFALNVYGIARANIQECPYDPRILAHMLIRNSEHHSLEDFGKVPVVITDELMALATAQEALGMAIVGSSKPPKHLILRTARTHNLTWLRDGVPVAGFPRYNVSICTRRPIEQSQLRHSDAEWFAYVEDAWRIFLRGNMHFVASRAHDLQLALSAEANKVIELAMHKGLDLERSGLDATQLISETFRPQLGIKYHNSDVWESILNMIPHP